MKSEEMKKVEKKKHGKGRCYLRRSVNPGIYSVTGHSQIRFTKLVMFGPTERSISKTLLYNRMQPGQEEIQTSSLCWSLK